MTVPLVIILVALIHQPLLHVLTIHFQMCVQCTYLMTVLLITKQPRIRLKYTGLNVLATQDDSFFAKFCSFWFGF